MYSAYKEQMQKLADVQYSIALLNWDQEVYMPPQSGDTRARQVATLSGMAHELFTSDAFGDLLHKLSADNGLSPTEKKNVELTLEQYTKQKRYTTEFVERMSYAVSDSFNAWQKAREANDYSLFEPSLIRMTELKKQECEILGYEGHPYNALLNEFEKGVTVEKLDRLFEEVRAELVPFVRQIRESTQVNDAFMYQHYDGDKQWAYGMGLLKEMGFDFEAGRQDRSMHPFTTSFSSRDVRITTRVNERDFNEMLWSTIHEAGHGLYEQGLPIEEYGMPLGEAIGMGIHESQSRLWENNVGRGWPFWKFHFEGLQAVFPQQLKGVEARGFYKAMNKVESSLIRTNADELTYHFHIMVRYEIEKALFDNSLAAKDLMAYWNQKYKDYLGIDVPDAKQGILQDVHWSHGSFGYFPTYSMGSFYAAQFYATADRQLGGLAAQLEKGDQHQLLQWLRENVHRYGKFYTSEELCQRISGEGLNFRYFMEYARAKYKDIYDLH